MDIKNIAALKSNNAGLTVSQAISVGKSQLADCSGSCSIDALLILGYVTGRSKVNILTRSDDIISQNETGEYLHLISERKNGKPVAYITHCCEFMSLPFYVDANVLIPRPDTETLVEKAIELLKEYESPKVLELGTGSGCIAVSLAKYANAQVTALDIDQNCLAIAAKNADSNGCNVRFIQSDLFESVPDEIYNLIISNPPYINTGEIPYLSPSVKDFEPRKALDGGSDGLDFYRAIIPQSLNYLRHSGMLCFEIGYDQGESVKRMMRDNGFDKVGITKDLAGLDRVLSGMFM